MFLADIFDFILSTQYDCGVLPPDMPGPDTPIPLSGTDAICPFMPGSVCLLPSTFSPVAAAFATLGYYAQAYWIDQITMHHLQTFAIAIYILAGFWGLVSFVMGGRPQQYLWLFIGPPLFWWLVEQRSTVPGVNWMNGNVQQDQAEIFKRAEVGLFTDSYIQTYGFDVHLDNWPDGGGAPPDTSCGDDGACVSDFFAYLDYLVSDIVRQLVELLGANNKMFRDSVYLEPTNIVTVDPGPSAFIQVTWDQIADNRWQFFQGIGQARAQDPNVHRLVATFLGSECGSSFIKSIDKGRLLATKNGNYDATLLPVLKTTTVSVPPWQASIGNTTLWENLSGDIGPSDDLRSLLVAFDDIGAIPFDVVNANRAGAESNMLFYAWIAGYDVRNFVTCQDLFTFMLQGLRWEASHIAYQLMTSGPKGVEPKQFVAAMFQGWDIKDPDFIGPLPPGIDEDTLPQFVQAMVLAYLWRNEVELSSISLLDRSYITSTEQSRYDMEAFQRNVNQKEKYGELYSWAKMVPHFQGNLLYFLAIAYPFAAMFVIAPGMGKVFVQWIQFFVWVKIWDVGFALVNQLERTVWAVAGSSTLSTNANYMVYQLMKLNRDNICSPLQVNIDIPRVAVDTYTVATDSDGVAMIDRMLALMGLLDLDLNTSYYIYIMSALYMSVPALTGSMVLGAKAGMSSMLSSSLGGISSPIGRAAGSAAGGDVSFRNSVGQAIGSQEGFAKGSKGFASAAIGSQNESQAAGIQSRKAGFLGGAIDTAKGAIDASNTSGYAASSLASSTIGLGANIASEVMPDSSTRRRVSGIASSMGPGGMAGGTAFPGLQGAAATIAGLGEGGGPGGSNGAGGPGAGGMSVAGQLMDWGLDKAGAAAVKIAPNAAQWGIGKAQHDLYQGNIGAGVKLSGERLDASRAGSKADLSSSLANTRGGREEAQSGYGGEMSGWRARADMGMAKSSTIAAMTGSAGSLNPGSMPTNMMGMAMSGKYGSETQNAARAAHAGGSLTNATNQAKGFMDGLSGSKMTGAFHSYTPGELMGMGGNVLAQGGGEMLAATASMVPGASAAAGQIKAGAATAGSAMIDWSKNASAGSAVFGNATQGFDKAANEKPRADAMSGVAGALKAVENK